MAGQEPPSRKAVAGTKYQHALDFLDQVITHGRAQDLEVDDRLDAQGLVWCVVDGTPPDTWSVEDKGALMAYRDKAGEVVDDDGETGQDLKPPKLTKPANAVDAAELAEELLISPQFIEEVGELLAEKRQVVFYGPPGTGKTYLAKRLAAHFAGDKERVGLVQFHPSYAYEDFVEGYRPADGGGFKLVDGPLKRIAADVVNSGQRHVLVIDEINRANVSKVLGELYFLLEYRDEEMDLQYSRRSFALPSNLWFIATMNTADRSIALLDAALRRRFFFVPLFPDREPIHGLLDRWLAREKPELAWLATVVDKANELLRDRDAAIGPSYFMTTELNERWIERIWQRSVIPYLEERLVGEPGRVADFDLSRLRAAVGHV